MPRYTVVCEWEDRGVSDADEIIVVTDTPEMAIERARKKWRVTIGAEWPHCRLVRTFLLTKEMRSQIA